MLMLYGNQLSMFSLCWINYNDSQEACVWRHTSMRLHCRVYDEHNFSGALIGRSPLVKVCMTKTYDENVDCDDVVNDCDLAFAAYSHIPWVHWIQRGIVCWADRTESGEIGCLRRVGNISSLYTLQPWAWMCSDCIYTPVIYYTSSGNLTARQTS